VSDCLKQLHLNQAVMQPVEAENSGQTSREAALAAEQLYSGMLVLHWAEELLADSPQASPTSGEEPKSRGLSEA